MTEQLARKHFERGRQFELQDKGDEALSAYLKSCQLQPSFSAPFEAVGRMLALQGRFSEAVVHLDTAIELGADSQTRQWRGYVLGRLHRYEDALADYLQLRELADHQIEVNIGRMLLALRRFDEAENVLSAISDPTAVQLLNAIPRYREFDVFAEDVRSIRYLFGGTCVLGTLGESGLRIIDEKYQLLDYAHIAFTLHRFIAQCRRYQWSFDVVIGAGARHQPFAQAVAQILNLPWREKASSGYERYLVCSSVIDGVGESAALTKELRDAGVAHLHFTLGLIPKGDPSPSEPHLVGFVNRCAVPWYRVEPFSRLQPGTASGDSNGLEFHIGPAFINPNRSEVVRAIVDAYKQTKLDSEWADIDAWYRKHQRLRCSQWDFGTGDLI